jgi:hypothetical protein
METSRCGTIVAVGTTGTVSTPSLAAAVAWQLSRRPSKRGTGKQGSAATRHARATVEALRAQIVENRGEDLLWGIEGGGWAAAR